MYVQGFIDICHIPDIYLAVPQPNDTTNNEQQGAAQSQPSVPAANAADNQPGSDIDNFKARSYPSTLNASIPAWYERPEWWTLIVTAFAAGIVGWQSWETRKAANAALTQIRTSTNRDRARIKFHPLGMVVIDDLGGREYWLLQCGIGLRNVGIGMAYILSGKATLKLRFDYEKPKLKEIHTENLFVVDGFIPPNTPVESPLIEEIFYAVSELSVFEQASNIFSGVVVPYIFGFIEYETAGTIFRSNFHYSWRSRERTEKKSSKLIGCFILSTRILLPAIKKEFARVSGLKSPQAMMNMR